MVNLFGGSVMGYNIGVVSGLTKPLIQCTLFKESDNIPLNLYIVISKVFINKKRQISYKVYSPTKMG